MFCAEIPPVKYHCEKNKLWQKLTHESKQPQNPDEHIHNLHVAEREIPKGKYKVHEEAVETGRHFILLNGYNVVVLEYIILIYYSLQKFNSRRIKFSYQFTELK
jgi:hypothetical protein